MRFLVKVVQRNSLWHKICDKTLDNEFKWWMSLMKCKSNGNCFLFFFLSLLFLVVVVVVVVVVVPYPVSVGQCFLQRSYKNKTLTGIFLSNERFVDARIPCCLSLYPYQPMTSEC